MERKVEMKLLLGCARNKKQEDLLWSRDLKRFFLDGAYNRILDDLPNYLLNGKIVAECDFEVEEIIAQEYRDCYCTSINHMGDSELQKRSCLTLSQLCDYLGTKEYGSYELVKKVGYAIHIKNLHIFDKPKELSEVYKIENIGGMLLTESLANPRNMMRVSVNSWDYGFYNPDDINVLLPRSSKELCRILNGEQTIIITKRVLKEMLK